jgi:virulence factor Mce-like protein
VKVTERTVMIATGACAIVFASTCSVLGVKVATGGREPHYHVFATFDAAGQGLIRDSDVKIHGVLVGRVDRVELVDGRARVRMEIQKNDHIPVDAIATVRPKTLFGEKFVDIAPGSKEESGPFIPDDGAFDPENVLGGFELEKVLSDAFPILRAVEASQLMTIVDTLAAGGKELGPAVNRTIAQAAQLLRVNAEHDADTRQFLSDLAALSDELAARADDVVAGAADLNDALPTLNSRGDELASILDAASQLAGDLSDVLEANRSYLTKAATVGGRTIQVLYDDRDKLPALVSGLRSFFEVLASAASHDDLVLPDGTRLAAIKFAFGGGSIVHLNAPASISSGLPREGTLGVPIKDLPKPERGAKGVLGLLEDLLR